ncbi:cytosine permease [Streptomyces kronopolitis]
MPRAVKERRRSRRTPFDITVKFAACAVRWICIGRVQLLVPGPGTLARPPGRLFAGHPRVRPLLGGVRVSWATLSLNIPDFTRFGAGQRAQVWGQSLGLPTTMTVFALLSVLVTSGSQAVYGAPIWDPVALAGKSDSVFGLLFALVTVLIATISVNIAANVVSPAYDLAHLAPKLITFRRGALITGVVGVVILPWKLTATPELYIFTWLGVVGGLLGTVAGILIADYWIIRRTVLDLTDLYRPGGRYWYASGWNWRAVLSFAVGGLLAVGGSYSRPGKGPFPTDGLIPFLRPLADYGWAIGLCTALALYTLLMTTASGRGDRAV